MAHHKFFPAFFIIAVFLVISVLSSGCGVYNNLTTYFNTFYNAKHLYNTAVDEVVKADQKDRDTNYFALPVVAQNSSSKFDSVIIKCSKIIQYHPECSYVEESILMIGVSYYYENESESAIKKFQELINNFPNSDNRFIAKLWFAKTEYIDKKPDAAVTVLAALIPEAHDAGKRDIELEASMLKAQVYFDRKDYDLALDQYQKSLVIEGNGYLRALAAYQIGMIYEAEEKFADAAPAYNSVEKYDPDNGLLFKSQYRYASMLARTGKYTEALNMFNDILFDQNDPESKGLVNLEIAKTYTMQNDTAKAFDKYRLMDTTFRSTAALDRSNYVRGQLFENTYKDLRTSLSYYQKVTGQGPNSDIGPVAKQKTATFTHYFSMYDNLRACDSMLHPFIYKRAYRDSVDSSGVHHQIKLHGADSVAALSAIDTTALTAALHDVDLHQDTLTQRPPGSDNMAQNKAGDTNLGKTSLREVPLHQDSTSSPGGKIPDNLVQNNAGDVALKHTSLREVALHKDSAASPVRKIPDNIAQKNAADTSGQNFRPPDVGNSEVPDSLFTNRNGIPVLDTLRSPRRRGRPAGIDDDIMKGKWAKGPLPATGVDSNRSKAATASPPTRPVITMTPDSIKRKFIQTEFELASVFLLDMNMPDSAEVLYQKILQDSNSAAYYAGSLYALANIYYARSDSAKRDSLYSIILDKYGKSQYSKRIKMMRGLAIEAEKKNPADTVFVQVAMLIADTLMPVEKKGKAAIDLLQPLILSGDTTTTVPKALYTMGWIYENVLINNDSAASIYRVLIKRYPTSIYASDVGPKVAVKDDPKSLSQFVKVQEIQSTSRGVHAGKNGKNDKGAVDKDKQAPPADDSAVQDDQNTDQNDDEEIDRSKDRDVSQDSDDDSDDNSDDDPNNQ